MNQQFAPFSVVPMLNPTPNQPQLHPGPDILLPQVQQHVGCRVIPSDKIYSFLPSSVGKQSQLRLQPTEVELGLQVGVEFDHYSPKALASLKINRGTL